jgi:hypothetical protein
MFTELKCLSLMEGAPEVNISDATAYLGFMKMENLTKLKICGFQVNLFTL